MSMQLGGSGGVKSDINVTPLVDVMLVLLIIMMIVAPLLQQGVAVTLPIATNTSEKPETQEQTVVAITADKRLLRQRGAGAEGATAAAHRAGARGEEGEDRHHQGRCGRRVRRRDGGDGHAAREPASKTWA